MNAQKFKIIKPYQEMLDYLAGSHIGRPPEGGIGALRERLEAEGSGEIRALRLPWRQLDKSVGYGFAPGQTTIIAGSAGAAKSYLVLNLLQFAGKKGLRWTLLPLEDDASRWVQRMLAAHACSWSLVMQPKEDTDVERRRVANEKLAALEANRELVEEWYGRIAENPRLPVSDGKGGMESRDVDYRDILAFVEDAAAYNDLIAIDPLTQIDFSEDGRADYQGQNSFMRKIVSIAAATGVHVVMVAHFAKGGRKAADPLDAVQGSSLFAKIAHNVLTLSRHDPAIESDVFDRFNPLVTHKLTLAVLKGRGGMSGDRIAFDLDAYGPRFLEHGLIKPKVKR